MSLKFAAVGNLMVIVVLEERALRKDRRETLWPTESYDPLLAMIGRSRKSEAIEPKPAERTADQARW